MAKKKNTLEHYRNQLKKYRKENPGVPFHTAQKRVSDMLHEGKSVTGTKPKAKKKTVTVKETVSKSTQTRSRSTHTAKTATIKKADGIVRKIDTLENQRKGVKDKVAKDIYSLEINKLHKELKAVRASAR